MLEILSALIPHLPKIFGAVASFLASRQSGRTEAEGDAVRDVVSARLLLVYRGVRVWLFVVSSGVIGLWVASVLGLGDVSLSDDDVQIVRMVFVFWLSEGVRSYVEEAS